MARHLQRLGLSPVEARAYETLLRSGNLTAQRLAELVDVPRSSMYLSLRALQKSGLVVEANSRGGTRFSAVPAQEALDGLIETERHELRQREQIAKEVIEELSDVAPADGTSADEPMEVLRNRRVIASRFERLQREAQREINILIKAPVFMTGGNAAQADALDRGVRIRTIYEEAVLEDRDVRPYLEEWFRQGEEARLYPTELPCKLALFDSRIAIMPLLYDGQDSAGVTTALIRNTALGAGLQKLFDCLWAESKPFSPPSKSRS